MRRAVSLGILGAALAAQFLFPVQVGAAGMRFTYSVKEARAYAYKASLSKEVVEPIPKCKPEEDEEYRCTDHNHKPNCPTKIEIGPKGKAPMPKPPKGIEPITGGAGEGGPAEEPPPQSSAIRLNRYLSLGKLTRLFAVKESGGMASQIYTDQSGRSQPAAHTISEGFNDNIRRWEERCYWNGDSRGDVDSYEHYLSRSARGPDTYHLAECIGRQCNFGLGINAERAREIVLLKEAKGKVVGSLHSFVEGLNFGGSEGLTIDSVETYVRFETDGTEAGLRWSVASTASDAEIGGNPVPLPAGGTVQLGGHSVGMAEPYVDAAPDGGSLTIVAPGVHFGSDQQSAFFGGAEVYMSMGQEVDSGVAGIPEVDGGGEDISAGSADLDAGAGNGVGTGVTDILGGSLSGGDDGQAEAPVAAGDPGALLVFEKATGVGAVAIIVALGGFCWFLLLTRWLQRYPWGRRMIRRQPFHLIDWVYRAFIKT